MLLDNDNLYNILLYSDINTIVNTCTSNKYNSSICNTNFWLTKFELENLPFEKQNTFNQWVNMYVRAKQIEQEAKNLLKMYATFNNNSFLIQFKEYSHIILDENILEELHITQDNDTIMIMYTLKNNIWEIINVEELGDEEIVYRKIVS
jgi:hypothetical protein